MAVDEPARTVKTADRVFDVVETVQELDGATATEVADALDMAVSTAYDHLVTLQQRGYLVTRDGAYHVGLKFLDHGMYARRNIGLTGIAQPVLEQIAEETGEVAWLLVEEHDHAVYLNKARGEQALQTAGQIGKRWQLHCLAAGKLFLAYRSDEQVQEYLDRHGLPRHSEHTITDPDELFARLEGIRERGFAYHDQEAIPNVRGVAAPITHDGKICGAISTGGPVNRIQGEYFREELPDIVTGAAIEIELQLKYPNQERPPT